MDWFEHTSKYVLPMNLATRVIVSIGMERASSLKGLKMLV
jgi:hypothetical protein